MPDVLCPPPRGEKDRPRIYVSGPYATIFDQIRHPNLLVRVLSERVGHASGIKMCYGAMTKGTTALAVELLNLKIQAKRARAAKVAVKAG